MPRLVCRPPGRRVHTVSPIETLVAKDRRVPRCGAHLDAEGRDAQRRRTSGGPCRADSAGRTD